MDDIINWMGGWPNAGLLSMEEWETRIGEAGGRNVDNRPETPQGNARLRERLLADGLAGRHAPGAERLLILPGADGALERVARGWLRPGDAVLAESPTGRSALQTFRKAGVSPRPVPSDARGMLPKALELALRQSRPRLVYVAPSCTDPEGRAWSGDRREALLRHCAEAGVPVLIDDRQANLTETADQPEPRDSEGRDPSDPKATRASEGDADDREANDRGAGDRGAGDRGAVWTIGELPPGTIGGLRLGWLSLGGTIPAGADALLTGEAAGTAVPEAEQRALLALMEEGELSPLLAAMRFICRAKNGLLAEQLERRRLPDTGWRAPEGGMHLWLSLPEGLDGEALLRAAWLNGLLFQPGGGFYAEKPDRCKIRLTVVHSEEKQIRAGVQRLAETMADFLGRRG